MARGKTRNPAPVSGPGALSRRTDGGPGSKSQPLRVPTGGPYGQAQALEAQQKAAPLAASLSPRTPPGAASAAGGAPAMVPGPEGGVFGPTQRPSEPGNAGALPVTAQASPDLDMLLRIMYSKFPHPQLLRLMRR